MQACVSPGPAMCALKRARVEALAGGWAHAAGDDDNGGCMKQLAARELRKALVARHVAGEMFATDLCQRGGGIPDRV